MRQKFYKVFVLRICAVLTYVALLFEWALAAMPYLSSVSGLDDSSDPISRVVPQSPVSPTVIEQNMPMWLICFLIGLIIVTTAWVVFTSLYRAPKTVRKTMQHVSDTTAQAVIPIVIKHKVTVKERKRLTARIAFYIKLSLIIAPIVTVVVLPFPAEISEKLHGPILVIVFAVAFCAMLLSGLQLIFARIFHLPYEKVW